MLKKKKKNFWYKLQYQAAEKLYEKLKTIIYVGNIITVNKGIVIRLTLMEFLPMGKRYNPTFSHQKHRSL